MRILFFVFAVLAGFSGAAYARDAAFLDPGNGGVSEEAVKVDPKADIDVGETPVNVAKRASIFFVNQTNLYVVDPSGVPVFSQQPTPDNALGLNPQIGPKTYSEQGVTGRRATGFGF